MNLEGGLQKNGMKLYKEEGPRLFEKPALNNLSHIYEMHKESGSDDKNIEENEKSENKKNAKESSYTNMANARKESKPIY